MIRTIRALAIAGASIFFTAAAALWANPALAQDVPQSVTAFLEAAASPAAPSAAAANAPRPRGLVELVESYASADTLSAEQHCLASAVYFEARGESLEGQLAVAEVVLNRARSGRYPATWCGVVVQRSQFSFVRRGRIPAANRSSEAWRRAVAISRIAEARVQRMLPENVLWYHASYVRPSWGRRLDRNGQIGAHIFYR
jgi:spore germination cell wall hydrolase CwlJ-like protein